MKRRTKLDPMALIEKQERSFRRISADMGAFTLRGHEIKTQLHPSGWHAFIAALPAVPRALAENGLAYALLEAHASLDAPVKFARLESEAGDESGTTDAAACCYCLIGELPFDRWTSDISASSGMRLKALKPTLSKALAKFNRLVDSGDDASICPIRPTKPESHSMAPPPCDSDCLHELCTRLKATGASVEQYLADTDLEWSKRGGGWIITLDTESYFQRINIDILLKRRSSKIELFAHLCSELTRFRDVSRESRRALSLFLLSANARLRFVRATIIAPLTADSEDESARDTQVVLETKLPIELASPFEVKKAVSSLIVGARHTRLETEALMEKEVARAILKD